MDHHPYGSGGCRAAPTVVGALLIAVIVLPSAILHGSPPAKEGGKKPSGAKKGGKGAASKESDKVIVWLRVGEVVDGGVKIIVQPFQRLQDIAKAYGLGTDEILKANNNLSPNMIKAGQKLFIPGAASVKAIKTFVPADEIDELEGTGVQVEGGEAQGDKGKKGGGQELIKSGEITDKGVLHTVQHGQTLNKIASAYGVGVGEIKKAGNLKDGDVIQPGQKVLVPGAKKVVGVPGTPLSGAEAAAAGNAVVSGKLVKAGVLHTVMPGQTLWDISKAYGKKVDAILKANSLTNMNMIKMGMKLIIPGATKVVAVPCSKKGSLVYLQPVTFHRIHTGETKALSLFTPDGKINKVTSKVFQGMMFDHRTNKEHKIHSRLIYLVAKVAEHFEFKTLIIYSGYRAYDKEQQTKESKHNVGRAIDFSVEGVSNWKLMKYCRTFTNVGVGYYPRSYFVHLDVREQDAFWIDYSGPGQKPKYGKKKPGLEKKAVKGAIPPQAGVDDEAESDAADVDITAEGKAPEDGP